MQSGWLYLDKPLGLTSTQSLGKARRLVGIKKGGHGGTLDPQATGVLPLAFGEATKLLPFMLDGEKTYTFTLTFGAQTASGDTEGDIVATTDARPSKEAFLDAIAAHRGVIEQTPPIFSALKVDGKRAYELARAGKTPKMKKRQVEIKKLELLDFSADAATCIATVTKGTYIRSLGQDLAEHAGSLGHLTMLRRDVCAGIALPDCIALEQVTPEALLPLEAPFDHLPRYQASATEIADLQRGMLMDMPAIGSAPTLVFTPQGQLASLVQAGEAGKPVKILRNFPTNILT